VGTLICLCWWALGWSVRERVISPLRTLSNLLEAMREGDYSIRGRGASRDSALGEVMIQANAMAATLRNQRLGAVEATALLMKVMQEIDVALFTFDGAGKLKLVNRAGARLLSREAESLLGQEAAALGLAGLLQGADRRTVTHAFPGASGRWGVRRGLFRESGLPHTLLVVSDLTQALREEELQAWQSLVRVLGHELNNSLTPIKSLAGSLSRLAKRESPASSDREDMLAGLAIIESRSDSLSRFVGAYSRLAKLPRPRLAELDVETVVRRAAAIEGRLSVTVSPGPAITIRADADQVEQVLINLILNAADASLTSHGAVEAGWSLEADKVLITVTDSGPGVANPSNLFVPFFTTKPGGSGIGLVLSRQIAEAHGGSLQLANREGGPGCRATLVLPR
jgi:nitrogen fixation/metabolism regulation signal transduction histidine kinase